MIRVLLFILIIGLLWLILQVFFRLYGAYFTLKRYMHSENTANKPKSAEKMVKCQHCALHVPESKAYLHQGRTFCCEAHAKAHAKKQS